MTWGEILPVATLLVAYFAGLAAIGVFVNNVIGKRIDDLQNNTAVQIESLKTLMQSEHASLSQKVDKIEEDISALNQNFMRHLESHVRG